MNFIKKENHTFTLSIKNKPVITVKSGASITFETYDCNSNQIISDTDDLETLDFNKVNSATGPVYIENSKPNQVLKVNIESIELQGIYIASNGIAIKFYGYSITFLYLI